MTNMTSQTIEFELIHPDTLDQGSCAALFLTWAAGVHSLLGVTEDFTFWM